MASTTGTITTALAPNEGADLPMRRRRTVDWRNFPTARRFLLRFAEQFTDLQSAQLGDRRNFISRVIEEFVQEGYLQVMLERQEGLTFDDVQRVRTVSERLRHSLSKKTGRYSLVLERALPSCPTLGTRQVDTGGAMG